MNTRELNVAVIGAGIGGLTAAIALRRVGANVRVFERAREIKEVGAGLGVWANAVRVLDQLGAGEGIRHAAQPMEKVGIYSAAGKPLGVTDMAVFTRELGVPSFVMHRADLQNALLAVLPKEALVTGAECLAIAEDERGCDVRFVSGDAVRVDLVVGADGFNSIVRRQLWGDTPVRYSGQTCYRGVVKMPIKRPGLLAEMQGRGRRLGHCPFSTDRMYWFACHNAARNEPEDLRGAKAKLVEMFAGWPFEMTETIAGTPDDAILRNDLCDRAPLKRWSRGRVTLLGDAAHPMLPNLGQGACTAIEDGAVLARCIRSESSFAEALARYEAARIPRTTRMVNLSWRFGQFARWENPLAVTMREILLGSTPEAMMRREFSWQLSDHVGRLTES